MKRKREKAVPDVDIVKAILDLCGVQYGESYFDGGWTRAVRVKDAKGYEHAVMCDRWGARACDIIVTPPVPRECVPI